MSTNYEKNFRVKHGMRRTRFYSIWCGMKARTNPMNKFISKNYLGIIVCDNWKNFINFKNDMYPAYQEACAKYGELKISIDRIDNMKGYFKENCRWVDILVQANNKNRSIKLNVNGELLSPRELAKKLDVSASRIYLRIRRGQSDLLSSETALRSKPRPKQQVPVIAFNKEGKQFPFKSVTEGAKHFGLWKSSVHHALSGRSKSSGGMIWKYIN